MDGQKFKEKLKELGITQVKAAEILGVTPQTVNAMMKNASITTTTLERLAKAIGRDISVFLSEGETPEKYHALLKAKDDKIKELEATIQRLIGIIEKMQGL